MLHSTARNGMLFLNQHLPSERSYHALSLPWLGNRGDIFYFVYRRDPSVSEEARRSLRRPGNPREGTL